jgi:hypothetical protein
MGALDRLKHNAAPCLGGSCAPAAVLSPSIRASFLTCSGETYLTVGTAFVLRTVPKLVLTVTEKSAPLSALVVGGAV